MATKNSFKYSNILICPKCKVAKLNLTNNLFICTNKNCNNIYQLFNDKPVLIDFENSIVEKDLFLLNIGSSVVKRNFLNKFNFLKYLFKQSTITYSNIRNILQLIKKSDVKILIIGGAEKGNGLKELYSNFNKQIISIDIYNSKHVDIIADAHSLPFINNSFDLVIIQAVLEHVLEPNVVVDEIHRVLCPEGIVYSEIPFLQQVHEGPFDFTRYTHSGHRYLFRNFHHINSGFTKGVAHFLLWAIDSFFCSLFRSKAIGKLFKVLFFWLLYLEKFIPEKYNIDGASGTFFLGSKKNENLQSIDIIKFYRGSQK